MIAAGSESGTALVWDRVTGDRKTPLLPHGSPVRTVGFSPDLSFVATGSDDGVVRIWNLTSAQQQRVRLKTNEDTEKQGLTGQKAVRIDKDEDLDWRSVDVHSMQIFSATNNQSPISPPLSLTAKIVRAAFSRDRRLISAVGANRTVRVWDWRKGQPLTPELKMGEEILDLQFSENSSALFVFLQDGGGEWLSLAPAAEPSALLQARAELLAGQVVNSNSGLTRLTLAELSDRWKQLGSSQSFSKSMAAAHAWREKEAGECEAAEIRGAALSHLNSLRALSPTDPKIALRQAWTLAELSRFAEAQEEFARAVELGTPPGEAWPLAALAALRQGSQGDFERPLAALFKAAKERKISDDETALAAWVAFLGHCGLDQILDWLAVANEVAARQPNDPRIHAAIAFGEFRLGHPQAAFDMLQTWRTHVPFEESVPMVWIQAMAELQMNHRASAEQKFDYLRAHRPMHGPWDYMSELQLMLEETRQQYPETNPF